MKPDVNEALRYLGASGAGEDLREQVETVARRLAETLTPRYVYRVYPLTGDGRVTGTGLVLTGKTAEVMLEECREVAVLACTLGVEFDRLLRREQAGDMAGAVVLDACGSAWVEAGCDQAQAELAQRMPGAYFTDRFSPGYGDLPLALQHELCAALDTGKTLGLYVTDSLMLTPTKSVTALIGISDTPRPARVRGCAFCSLRETCGLRKGGEGCGR